MHAAQGAVVDAALQAASQPAFNQPSKLFPQLFRNCGEGERITVLNIGKATPGTGDYFSQFACKVHFKDLYSDPVMRLLESSDEDLDLKLEFSALFDFAAGSKFDVCLFWDFLNFLNAPALRAFSAALRPYIHHGTRCHGFGVHNVGTRLRNQQFSIASADGFHVRDRQEPPLRFYPHAQTELYELLGHLDIDHGILLPDGKVEFLLKTVF